MTNELPRTRQMHLIAYLKTGPSAYRLGWRHPEESWDFLDPASYVHAARVMEAAKLDAVMFADLFGFPDTWKGSFETYLRYGGQNNYLDPLTVLPIMAHATTRLGLAATVSISFFNAFHLARSLGSLDVLSKGRVAWNVITSTSDLEAKNAGMDALLPHDERYDRADEVVEAVLALWKTWDEDPFILDKKAGIFADPAKVHYANYVGKWTKTRGPLPTPRSLQGHPVLMQAGSSERGRTFASRWGEVIFVGGSEKHEMQALYEDMHRRLAATGRDPSRVRIVASVMPIIGETESIARERAEYLESLEAEEMTLASHALHMGVDLSKHRTTKEVVGARGNQGSHGLYDKLEQEKEKDLVKSLAKTRPGLVGTPETIADRLQDLFESRACDGFVISPAMMMHSHEQFCRAVVPELQRRGIFRREYRAATLRENILS